MKKLLVSVLAIAGLVACTQETTLVQKGKAPMEFGAAFVDNATRADKAADPSITTANITGFDVWGFMDSAEGVVFVDEDVTGEQGNFTYVNTQYWAPGHNYYFAALAPMNSENVTETLASGDAAKLGLGTIKFNVTDGAEDLLYSAVGPIASPAANATTVEPVKFQFNHMLSKVKFSFTNGFDNDNAYIDVKNIKMVVPETGTIDLAVADWWSTNQWVLDGTTTEIAFGDACNRTVRNGKQESADERIILPADATQKYTVTFDVVLYQGTVEAYKGTKTVTIENVALEIGKAYNFKAELNASNVTADGSELLPIVFDVEEVKDWVTAETPDVNVQEAELRAALLLGGEVTLTKDLEITEPLVVAAGTSSVINLNGKNIINKTKTLEYGKGEGIVVYGDLVINGEGLVKGSTRAVWARGSEGATVTINGGTYEGCEEGYAEGGNSVVYASSGNVVNIYGGNFKALAADKTSYANKTEGVYAALNVADNNGMINVYGGSFYKQNPAAPGTEPAAWNAAHANGFVAEGYFATLVGDYYVVSDAQVVANAEELTTAVENGAKKLYLMDGTYTFAKYPAGVELVGYGDNVVFDLQGKVYGVNGGDVAIENVKLVFSNANYKGFQHTNVESYKNCTIVGQPFLYGADVTFEGCTFEQTSASAYNVWTYGAKAVKFVDCVFNCAGKSVLIYAEGSSNGQVALFEGCTLNASAPAEGKAAIEIDSSLIKGVYDITINDTTATGFANGNVSGNSLWNNKKGDKATITVDGVKVL